MIGSYIVGERLRLDFEAGQEENKDRKYFDDKFPHSVTKK